MSKTYVNPETGEILREPPFVKLYFQALANHENLSGLESATFVFLLSRMDSSNISAVGRMQKDEFALKNRTTPQCVSNAIQKIKNKGLIKILSKGEYLMSGRIASKTNWEGVVKIILRQEFSASGVASIVEFVSGNANN